MADEQKDQVENITPDATPAGETTPDVPPSSSDGEGDEPSFLDALSKAVETEPTSSSDEPQPEDDGEDDAEAEASAEETPDQTAETETEEDPEDLPDEPSEAELKAMSARTKRRIEKLLAERKEARGEAEQAKPILSYMRENDIPMQDVDVVLGMAAQLRHGDFAGFLRTVEPYVNLARQYTGQVLPKDLKEQVDQGFVSPQVAQELAYRRAQEQVSKQQAQRQSQAQENEVRNLRGQAIRTAVQQWEDTVKRSDPDYEAKADLIRRTAQALIAERGAPQTPEDAVSYVKMAYEEANKTVTRFRPKPKATQPTPSSVHQSSKTPQPEPDSMFDVVRQSLGQ